VGIARALVRGAPILLLDEPTAGLDEAAESAVMRAVRDSAAGGTAVVLVAHRPGAVAGADRTVEVSWTAIERAVTWDAGSGSAASTAEGGAIDPASGLRR
jgi:ATP-binding cassette subfamily C protein CydD